MSPRKIAERPSTLILKADPTAGRERMVTAVPGPDRSTVAAAYMARRPVMAVMKKDIQPVTALFFENGNIMSAPATLIARANSMALAAVIVGNPLHEVSGCFNLFRREIGRHFCSCVIGINYALRIAHVCIVLLPYDSAKNEPCADLQ
jgi:hypothetical protein